MPQAKGDGAEASGRMADRLAGRPENILSAVAGTAEGYQKIGIFLWQAQLSAAVFYFERK